MDNRGNITVEIAIVVIVLLMISGMILNSQEQLTQKVVKTAENKNIENLIGEVADNLINNPGSENWYRYKSGTPGLAIVNEEGQIIPNSVSFEKFMVLGSDYKKLVTDKIFGSKIKTSIEIIPHESKVSSVKIGLDEDSKNIYSVTRFVKCDFYKKYVLKDFQNDGKCNRNHNQKSDSCNYYKIFKGNLRKSDYYLLIDSNENDNLKYYVDTTRIVKEKYWQPTKSDCIYLNTEINFYDDNNAVVFIHFDKPHVKAVLVSVPTDFDKNNLYYDYFKTNDCDFILKAWY